MPDEAGEKSSFHVNDLFKIQGSTMGSFYNDGSDSPTGLSDLRADCFIRATARSFFGGNLFRALTQRMTAAGADATKLVLSEVEGREKKNDVGRLWKLRILVWTERIPVNIS